MELVPPKTVKDIADLLNGKVIGNPNSLIFRLNRIEYSKSGDLTFFSNKKYFDYLVKSDATAILVPLGFEYLKPKENQSFIEVDNPYNAFFRLLLIFDTYYKKYKSYTHPTAVIGEDSQIDPSAYIGAYTVIGNNCKIGKNSILMPNVTLYDNVQIGDNCIIHSNVVCYHNTKIGNNCIIHSGAVIGSDGFGFIENNDKTFTKIPQLGNVEIGDNVEIGANTTIDRAIVGSTIIENGVKIDNLVQIAHNVHIGENTAIASQTGISGSTKIGKRNRIAGQVGVAGHLRTADDVTLEAKSGVAKSLEESGVYFGAPAKKKFEAFKVLMSSNELPNLLFEFNKLKKILKEKFDIDL